MSRNDRDQRAAQARGGADSSRRDTSRRLVGAALALGGAWALGAMIRRLAADPLDLAGRVVVVTGGSRGLGLLIARELGRRGCRLVLCGRHPTPLERARAELEARGVEVLTVPADVADEAEVHRLIEAALDRFGRIDALVNNASIIQVGPARSMEVADFDRAMAINFRGTLLTTLAVLPHMRARGEGRIVNVTSIGGRIAVPHLLPYSCAKFAAVALSEGMRAELAIDGIRVTTVVPWLMRTGSPRNALFKGDATAEWTWFSLADALPLVSHDAERAARRIVRALERGESWVPVGWQARAAGLVHDVLPRSTLAVNGLLQRLLPDGEDRAEHRGRDLSSPLSPSPLTVLMRRAEQRNNQMPA